MVSFAVTEDVDQVIDVEVPETENTSSASNGPKPKASSPRKHRAAPSSSKKKKQGSITSFFKKK